jgi:general stress protein YciG
VAAASSGQISRQAPREDHDRRHDRGRHRGEVGLAGDRDPNTDDRAGREGGQCAAGGEDDVRIGMRNSADPLSVADAGRTLRSCRGYVRTPIAALSACRRR